MQIRTNGLAKFHQIRAKQYLALTEAEDYIFIDAYSRVCQFIPETDLDLTELKHVYFDVGKMITSDGLISFNTYMTEQGLAPVQVVPGHADEYTFRRGY